MIGEQLGEAGRAGNGGPYGERRGRDGAVTGGGHGDDLLDRDRHAEIQADFNLLADLVRQAQLIRCRADRGTVEIEPGSRRHGHRDPLTCW